MTGPGGVGTLRPVPAGDRILELDVLRGVALFGVLLINFTGFAHNEMMATEEQLVALPTAAVDAALFEVLEWLVAGKAYTLFAFLFGLGFYVQMQRSRSRSGDFDSLYLRRLTVLLLFGIAHALFVWAWDILHLYAIAGFILFAMRRYGDRALLYGGVGLALFSQPAYEFLLEFTNLGEWHGRPSPFTDEAILGRQVASESGSYAELFRVMFELSVMDYVLTGAVLSWLAWSLGRLMIGAWVGRRGWLQDAGTRLPGFRSVMRIALPAGLVLSGVGQLLQVHADGAVLAHWDHWKLAGRVVHQLATPVLALGYVCAIVLAVHSLAGRRLFKPLAQAGRMALTNYVMQSLVIAFVLFGWGPGLALAGRIGTLQVTLIVLGVFAAQVALSCAWLARFRYGPLEWLWRTATYGRRQS